MYAFIRGKVEEKLEDTVVLETGGVGYNVLVSGNVLERLPARGEEAKLYTYTAVREDAIHLYGFLTRDDLNLFRLLLSVSGVGPKGALSLLSVMSADELRFSVLQDDAAAIAKAPGIGKKTAQKVILELKDKLDLGETLESAFEAQGEALPSDLGDPRREAVMALTALGYNSKEALAAVKKAELPEGAAVEEILKEALRQMAFL